jgi:hypothetical protein
MVVCERILSQLPESQHQKNADGIWDRTGIQKCVTSLLFRTARSLFFVDKLIAQDKKGQRQSQHATCSGPGVLTADHEICAEKSADEENYWRENIPNDLCKKPMPPVMSLART